MTIGPWAFLIIYDILLYIWRASTYEIPVIGGRARGRARPSAPSLSERPSGRRRAFSLSGTASEEGSRDDEGCDYGDKSTTTVGDYLNCNGESHDKQARKRKVERQTD